MLFNFVNFVRQLMLLALCCLNFSGVDALQASGRASSVPRARSVDGGVRPASASTKPFVPTATANGYDPKQLQPPPSSPTGTIPSVGSFASRPPTPIPGLSRRLSGSSSVQLGRWSATSLPSAVTTPRSPILVAPVLQKRETQAGPLAQKKIDEAWKAAELTATAAVARDSVARMRASAQREPLPGPNASKEELGKLADEALDRLEAITEARDRLVKAEKVVEKRSRVVANLPQDVGLKVKAKAMEYLQAAERRQEGARAAMESVMEKYSELKPPVAAPAAGQAPARALSAVN